MQLTEIDQLIEDGKTTPVVETTFKFSQARQTEEHQEKVHTQGKLVIDIACET